MAAGIMANDTMFSARNIRPWHGLGTVVDTAPTSADALHLAGLDWTVEQKGLTTVDGQPLDGWFANVRSDTNEPLGVVKGRYKIVQNTESFAFVDELMNMSGECRYETAGSLFNGKKTFLLVRMPEANVLGDSVENYMFFMNSHDGSSGITAGVSSVRVVCNNTLQFAASEAGKLGRLWHVRHTGNIKDKMNEARLSLKLASNYVELAGIEAQKMAEKKINEEIFFRTLFENWHYELKAEKAKEMADEIHDLYHHKPDLQNFRGTAWGMFNAVADYESNRKKKGAKGDYGMSTFMTGNRVITLAQSILAA